MPVTGLEVLGAATGIAGLIGTLTACCDVYERILTCKGFGSDIVEYIVDLLWQRQRFEVWCYCAGLLRIGGLEPRALEPRLKIPHILYTVTQFLAVLHGRLDKISKIISRYNKPGKRSDASTLVQIPTGLFQRFNIDTVLSERQRLEDKAASLQKGTSIFTKFRFSSGRQKLREALSDVRTQISELQALAPGESSDLPTRLLMISATSRSPSPLRNMATAAIRNDPTTSVVLDVEKIRKHATQQDGDSYVKTLSSWVLDPESFDLSSNPLRQDTLSRSTGTLPTTDGTGRTGVLVEWKQYPPALAEKAMFRAFDLCRLLKTSLGDQGFHTAHARGIIRDHDRSRLGLVYEYPRWAAAGTTPQSLLERLRRDNADGKRCTLGHRFDLAKNIARSLFRFLSTNWLHKSFRSDNILSFPKISATLGRAESNDKFIITGFDLSRPDVTDEFSERPQSEPGNDLYRHPDDVRNAAAEGLYRKEYDIYSLGVILTELALWKPILSVFFGK